MVGTIEPRHIELCSILNCCLYETAGHLLKLYMNMWERYNSVSGCGQWGIHVQSEQKWTEQGNGGQIKLWCHLKMPTGAIERCSGDACTLPLLSYLVCLIIALLVCQFSKGSAGLYKNTGYTAACSHQLRRNPPLFGWGRVHTLENMHCCTP